MPRKTVHKSSKKKREKRQFPFIALFFLALLVLLVFFTVFLLQQQQTFQEHAATTTCGVPGDKGNETGVGKYCTQGGGQCLGTGAPICSADIQLSGTGICSKPCNTNADCGSSATCFQDTLGKGCKPNVCDTSNPTATPRPTAKPAPTVIPTKKPTITTIPTSLPTIAPTAAVTPTPITSTQNTSLFFTVYLHGIGKSGDNSNPTTNTLSNKTPLQTQRSFTLTITNSQNKVVTTQKTNFTYNTIGGFYTATAALDNTWTNGSYTITLATASFLEKTLPGIQITTVHLTTIPPITLSAGDINNDGSVNAIDYNSLIACFGEIAQPVSCTATQKQTADLNDDGRVDQTDYNLFLREINIPKN